MRKLLFLLVVPFLLAACSGSSNELEKNLSVTGTMWAQMENHPGFGTGAIIMNFITDTQCEITFINMGKRSASNLYDYVIDKDKIAFTPREARNSMSSEGIIKNDNVLQYRLINPAPDAKQTEFIELKRIK